MDDVIFLGTTSSKCPPPRSNVDDPISLDTSPSECPTPVKHSSDSEETVIEEGSPNILPVPPERPSRLKSLMRAMLDVYDGAEPPQILLDHWQQHPGRNGQTQFLP